ncbi:hypothetical protein ASE01_08130 [Nocardioides sp. Root190]|uniref:TolB family protein n=1 Tax=Nocardioides sp. Root190 TaxID=1736488 RepID=UPI0006FA5B6D|nr:LpqB family beta-propeller domain-containing protein [Nocardioides sp. Root190]KRB78116.1 hypothetical protein ASE01_08130 [Nocardioides sp. Root190]
MALHHTLRQLVQQLGPDVLDDATALRGSLEDRLEDQDEDVAAITLLTSAVENGAVIRLVRLLDEGAEPARAVASVSETFVAHAAKSERGALWAIAAIGHALGRVDDVFVAEAHSRWQASLQTRVAPPVSSPPPSDAVPPTPPTPPPPPVEPWGRQAAAPTAPVPSTAVGAPPSPTTPLTPRRRRLPATVAAAVLVTGVLAGWWAMDDREPDEDVRTTPDVADSAGDEVTSPSARSEPSSSPGSTTEADASGSPEARTGFVAFSSRSGGTSRIQVLDLRSGDTRQVAAPGSAFQPSVSSDGKVVAFVVETDDGKRIAISRGADEPLLLDVGREPSDPAISPDGTAVAYVSQTDRGRDVSVRRLDETQAVVLAAGSADELDPTWSADGSSVAYVLTGSSNDSIVAVDVATGNEVSRTQVPGHAASPALSPDGDDVAFVASVQGNLEVVVSAVGGTASPMNVSQSAESEVGVIWLPDDRLLSAAPTRGIVAITPRSPTPAAITAGVGDSL